MQKPVWIFLIVVIASFTVCINTLFANTQQPILEMRVVGLNIEVVADYGGELVSAPVVELYFDGSGYLAQSMTWDFIAHEYIAVFPFLAGSSGVLVVTDLSDGTTASADFAWYQTVSGGQAVDREKTFQINHGLDENSEDLSIFHPNPEQTQLRVVLPPERDLINAYQVSKESESWEAPALHTITSTLFYIPPEPPVLEVYHLGELGLEELPVEIVLLGNVVRFQTRDTGFFYLVDCNLLGDFNSSGDVNAVDIQLIAWQWRTQAADPDWWPRFDVIENNQIDIQDIQLVANRWGESCFD